MSFFLLDEQGKSFLDMESTSDEDPMNIVKMTTKDLEYCLGLADTVVAGFERIDPHFKRNCTVGKLLSNTSMISYTKILHERNHQSAASFVVIFIFMNSSLFITLSFTLTFFILDKMLIHTCQ